MIISLLPTLRNAIRVIQDDLIDPERPRLIDTAPGWTGGPGIARARPHVNASACRGVTELG
jgi:hypothetical protein